jgi:geranylgeranyl diphosphate synthase, type II
VESGNAATVDLKARVAALRDAIDAALHRLLLPDGEEIARELREATEYAVFGGGKRLRPLVCLLSAAACGGREEDALPAAVALELIHSYSLVHDDLPAMDDDDLRRGRPTCHKVHGEGMAILAGDALLTRAFEVIARELPPAIAAPCAAEIARAAGVAGMVNGQAADLLGEGQQATEERVRWIHLRKTAALFRAAAGCGARCAGAAAPLLKAASEYGEAIGLAFQVVDDLLGQSGDPEATGKPVGKDLERQKLTYPAAIGAAAARQRAAAFTAAARAAAAKLPRPAELDALAGGLERRVA